MKTCIVIPVFNHERAVGGVVEGLRSAGLPVILVDDGSSETCRAVLQGIAEKEASWVSLVRLEENQGKGGAVIAGLREARTRGFTHAVQIDSDGQHDVTALPTLLAESVAHPEALISGRPIFDETVPKGRLYARYLTHIWVWINTLSFDIKDSMCGYRVYPLSSTLALLDRVRIGRRMDFDVEVLVRLHWDGVEIRQIPTKVTYPADGVSHFKAFADNVAISRMHAILFFGMLLRLPFLLWRKVTGGQQPAHWARVGERGSIWGMRFMLWVHRIFGRWLFAIFLFPVTAYFFLFVGTARRASHDYLQRLVKARPDVTIKPTWWTSYLHIVSLGQVMLDKMLAFSGGMKFADVTIHDRDVMFSRVKAGQGGVVLTAHLGNLEALEALSDNTEQLKLNILVHTKNAQNFNRIMKELRPNFRARFLEVSDFGPALAMEVTQRVAAGEWIVAAADRTPVESDRSVDAEFLGALAPLPAGPHVLAALCGCPVMLVMCLKQDGRYHVYYELFTEKLEWTRATRDAVIRESAQKYAKRLEHYCAIAPLQWFNFYPFWRDGK